MPLSKKLAELLGGTIWVESEVGRGSTFHFSIPRIYGGSGEAQVIPEPKQEIDPTRLPILVVEDNRETLFIYDKYLKGSPYQMLPARTLRQARESLAHFKPVGVVLDILLEHESTWEFLQELKSSPEHRSIPVLVVTVVDNRKKAMAMGADLFATKPVERDWLSHTLRSLVEARKKEKLLVIDDDEVSRYLLRGMLAQTRFKAVEAENGEEGLRKALEEKPDAILLDIVMPDILGFEVLRRLKANAETASIPVIIYTSKALSDSERKELASASSILAKNADSRDVALAELREALANAIAAYA